MRVVGNKKWAFICNTLEHTVHFGLDLNGGGKGSVLQGQLAQKALECPKQNVQILQEGRLKQEKRRNDHWSRIPPIPSSGPPCEQLLGIRQCLPQVGVSDSQFTLVLIIRGNPGTITGDSDADNFTENVWALKSQVEEFSATLPIAGKWISVVPVHLQM